MDSRNCLDTNLGSMVGRSVGILGSGVGKGILVPSGIAKVGKADSPGIGGAYAPSVGRIFSIVGVAVWMGNGGLDGDGVVLDVSVICEACPQADVNIPMARTIFAPNSLFITSPLSLKTLVIPYGLIIGKSQLRASDIRY